MMTLPDVHPLFPIIHSFSDDLTMGSLALVSKQCYFLVQYYYNANDVELFIIKYYLSRPEFIKRIVHVPIQHDGIICMVPISIHQIAKRKLRMRIGRQKYLDKYNEIFLESDIKYIDKIYHIGIHYRTKDLIRYSNKCVKMIIPLHFCIFCKQIKTKYNMHVLCGCSRYGACFYKTYTHINETHASFHTCYHFNETCKKMITYDLTSVYPELIIYYDDLQIKKQIDQYKNIIENHDVLDDVNTFTVTVQNNKLLTTVRHYDMMSSVISLSYNDSFNISKILYDMNCDDMNCDTNKIIYKEIG